MALDISRISVLSVEPYGMKRPFGSAGHPPIQHFSALGRAVWDETAEFEPEIEAMDDFSALGRAVWDETQKSHGQVSQRVHFSALGRAVWDETRPRHVTRTGTS